MSDDDLVLDAEARRRLRHDLRTPLTIVAGFAEVLAADREITEQDRREFATAHPGRGDRDPRAHRRRVRGLTVRGGQDRVDRDLGLRHHRDV